MKPIKTQIEELEREIEELKQIALENMNSPFYSCSFDDGLMYHKEKYYNLEAKLQTLKECKKMFEDYNEKLKKEACFIPEHDECLWVKFDEIDKLSKEVLGE